jgi:sugar porter (SP) family MFS transporter
MAGRDIPRPVAVSSIAAMADSNTVSPSSAIDETPLRRNGNLIKLYFFLLAPLVTSASWGFDLSLTNGLQSVDVFMDNFGNPTGATLGFYGASVSVGALCALFFSSTIVGRLGRRAACFIGSIIVIGMSIMEFFATTFNIFVAGKLLLGFGAVLQQIGGPMLVTELAHPRHREALTSFYNTSIYIGLVLGSWITFGTYSIPNNWSWRIPVLLQIALPIYQLVMIYLCPESPRWLVMKGRHDEALAILTKYHGNGIETAQVQAEFQEMVAGVEVDQSQMEFTWAGVKSLIGKRANQHRLLVAFVTGVGSQCAGSGLISTYLPEVLEQVGYSTSKQKTLINGIIYIFCWVVSVVAALLAPRIKRRSLFLFSTAGMLVSFIIWTALSAQYVQTSKKPFGLGVVVMLFIYEFFYSMCWLPMVVTYPLEIVTTKQRGVFYTFTQFSISASSFVISYVNPIGLENISWRYYIIQTIFIALLLVVIYFTFPETRGLTLEEVVTVFEGKERFESAVQAISMEKGVVVSRAHHVEKA